jgi:hypothetical protein
MENEPKIRFESDRNLFSDSSQFHDPFAGKNADGRDGGSQEKRAEHARIQQRLPQDALLQRLNVDRDVGQFRHVEALDLREWLLPFAEPFHVKGTSSDGGANCSQNIEPRISQHVLHGRFALNSIAKLFDFLAQLVE